MKESPMSRSYKKRPYSGITTAESEKSDKQDAHRVLRAHFRCALSAALAAGEEDFLFDERNRAHSNYYGFAKDGKQWLDVRVARYGRVVRVLTYPWYAQTTRDVHRILAK
jgi:hypothetical protein